MASLAAQELWISFEHGIQLPWKGTRETKYPAIFLASNLFRAGLIKELQSERFVLELKCAILGVKWHLQHITHDLRDHQSINVMSASVQRTN